DAGANAAISVVNQLIMAEIFSDVAGDGVGGEVFEAVVGSGLDALLATGADLLFETDVFVNLFQDVGLSADSINTIQGIGNIDPVSMVMTAVINAVLPDLETIEGQIASTVTSIAITTFTIITQTFSAFTGPIGAILSFIVGSIFDSIFKKYPQAFTHVGFDEDTGQFVILDTWSKDGGNTELSKALAQAYVDGMNGFVDLVKAESHNYDELGQWSFGHYEDALKNAGKFGRTFKDFQSTYLDAFVQDMAAADIIDGQRAVVRALESVNIEGYRIYREHSDVVESIKNAYIEGGRFWGRYEYNHDKTFSENTKYWENKLFKIYHSKDSRPLWPVFVAWDLQDVTKDHSFETLSEFDKFFSLEGKNLSDSDLTQLVLSRMQIANDYHKYLENRETINTLIAAEPESAFAAGWLATFIAAKDLGLDDPYILDGDEIDNVFYTADGDDVIDGKSGDDLIKTYGGDDILKGGTGDDTLIGGIGDDRLEGGADNDTYVIAGSFGKDVVIDSSGSLDTIRFEGTITLSDLKFVEDGDDLLVYKLDHDNPETALDELSNVLRIKDWQSSIERFEFADGSIKGRLALLSEGNDTFTGTSSDDLLMGLGGNDTLNAGSGHDTLVGGAGNDQLKGGSGNDTYIFERGFGEDTLTETSGTDTLRFTDGITLADLKIVADAGDLKFYLIDPTKPNQALDDITDVLTIKNWSADNPHIERFEFADGSVLSEFKFREDGRMELHGFNNETNMIMGTELSDFIYGGSKSDILYGGDAGASAQYLIGRGGDDTYLIGRDKGGSWITRSAETSSGGTDTVKFRDLTLDDLRIEAYEHENQGTSLRLGWTTADGNAGTLNVADMGEHIERYEFADGTSLSEFKVREDGRMELYGFNNETNMIMGTELSDFIYGGSKNDVLYGGDAGAGWQYLHGHGGDDTYLIGRDKGGSWITRSAETSSEGTDTVKFRDLTLNDLRIEAYEHENQGTALRLGWTTADGKAGSLHLADLGQNIERYEFADRTSLSEFKVREDGRMELHGFSNETNLIMGTELSDFIYGGSKNDVLYGGDAGAGWQYLHGHGGDDTYL
ncbi:calcium-binding protein, partial [Pseudovibrio sp. Ad37]|uniref:calcium-binding protein n=1 Tax=Pseudovibrio sp. Ad37 TaxID=989422 RepID=UPI000A8726A9